MSTILSDELYSVDYIDFALKTYQTPVDCQKLSALVFADKTARIVNKKTSQNQVVVGDKVENSKDETQESPSNKGFFYRMRFDIIKGRPIVVSKDDLIIIKKELRMPWILGKKIGPYEFLPRIKNLMGRWYVYYSDRRIDQITGVYVHGIARAVVYLKAFGRVDIDNYFSMTSERREYIGNYYIHETENEYFRLSAKFLHDGNLERDLNVLIYMGKNGPMDLLIGHWSNIGTGMASGTLLVDRTTTKTQRGKIVSKFFDPREPDFEEAPLYVRKFFTPERTSALYNISRVQDATMLYQSLRQESNGDQSKL